MVVRLQVRRVERGWAATTRSANCTPTPGSRRICGRDRFRPNLMHGKRLLAVERIGGWRLAATRPHAGWRSATKTTWARAGPQGARTGSIRPGRTTSSNWTANASANAIYQPIVQAVRAVAQRSDRCRRGGGRCSTPAWRRCASSELSRRGRLDCPGGGFGGSRWPLLACGGWLAVADRRAGFGLVSDGNRSARRAVAVRRNRVLPAFRASCWPGRGWFAPPAKRSASLPPPAGRILPADAATSRLAPAARRGRRRLLPRPFRPPAPGQRRRPRR